jgi:hypothetical protein
MNPKFSSSLTRIKLGGVALLAAMLLCGCESDRVRVPGVLPQGARGNLHPERPLTPDEIIAKAPTQPASDAGEFDWQPLFDGQSLAGWSVPALAGAGAVECRNGMILVGMGDLLSAVVHTNPIPTVNYEITLEAMRVTGTDFFCGLTIPVRDSHVSLILGGWGGSLTGISSIDGEDASQNETTSFTNFQNGRWYRVRLRVTTQKIEAWIEQKKIVEVPIAGRKLSLRPGDIELCRPLGLATWITSAAYRDIKYRKFADQP